MKFVAGVDIGNSTTEVAIADVEKGLYFLSSSIVKTSGIKGTLENVAGILMALKESCKKINIEIKDLGCICINEATPVIGDVAMETITETIITESTMIGHNPDTPGGIGIGIGKTIYLEELTHITSEEVICVIPKTIHFERAARELNIAQKRGVKISGAIVQGDDGVIISNRLEEKIPIVDEVAFIDKVPMGMVAAVEVSPPGENIKVLSNPYGLATVFNLSPEETKHVIPISRALIGNRSAVVIRTPEGEVKERVIPSGKIILIGKRTLEISVEEGSNKIMKGLSDIWPLKDVTGESGTNVGGMVERVRQVMGELTHQPVKEIKIQDILAVDTFLPQKIHGGVAGEFALENAVALAAMVKTSKLPMEDIARKLQKETNVKVIIEGIEANMAVLGALTTPGTDKPLVILDMGGGSTDAAYMGRDEVVKSIHHAGAGEMVTMLIKSELGLEDYNLAEDIKRYPLAKVESLFNLRYEDGSVCFYQKPLDSSLFARNIVVKKDEMIPIPIKESLEKIRIVRREAKKKVFITNVIRALKDVAPYKDIRNIGFVVLLGGSAMDFEIPEMISDELSHYGIVCGRGNIRGIEGPRNAVATGLVISYYNKIKGSKDYE
ncbi:diol dehydratase reactivase subunit alpha [Clostridium cochlearium]|jgi:diol dehydratase reactivase alpha subunit|uniref:Glycerol dehydratase reactivation factor large subunit n=1 Tax=Clostridium cochlearium TaxID=1494 RepID=A0A239ZQA3_CLOCO|nr:diol dehydratase reactivase subunit alpha [Clostridium cochlearium]MBV1818984.1 diol dehydratase reactivase subunit alpha [Bacteroidales bacterium MSK.15.36]NSJ91202.1 diol dehydratase reactivase subunit alpha [Coprococcus sp. MSK.21.13]MBE6064084.1 diol dehydratase reactivase subunit alpha [Clostridium cochlearium]MBU5269280.1 diol dehydratase reactivase subunit alpha [Clostridium cochlearium]MCG4572132.1 diol dehydratase reactivase subunit alpha [Clostridium cochlearium]